MDVSDDEAMPESFHGVAEDIAADGLDDIFHELRIKLYLFMYKKY